MALPTGPIPLVAFDEIIEESWGDSVAQSLNNLNQADDRLLWTPDTEYLATTSTTTWTNWFRVGGSSGVITVPDWAGHVTAHVGINGIHDTGAANDTYILRLKIGPEAGRSIRLSSPLPLGWFPAMWIDRLACSSIEGDRSVWIQAMRTGGADRFAVDNQSDVAVFLTFQGAIG
jgi:hypothetical protein